ncbi:Uncharacterised protein [Ectopseudomonas mendocina]|uniref:Uncharacterized protein n=2 Tax=Ectopseudomonas mendocina TaxID=300 RepID=A0A379PP94_ECTME|nr:Uncharacterised protein [Pseudomonas mendocina]
MWSGGMDSSLLACLLLEAKPAHGKLLISSEPITLSWNDHDILKWLVGAGCEKLEATSASLRDVVDRGGMVVAGYHADTLLCGDIMRYYNLYSDIWSMSVEDMMVRVASDIHEASVQSFMSDLQPLIDLMPLPKTAANVAYWLDFTCAWDSDEMTLKFAFDLEPPGVGYVNFFGARDFQLWSLQDVEAKVGKNKETHKRVYYELLSEIVGFQPTIPLNTEPGELYGTSMDMGRVLAITEDWKVIESPV